MDELLEGGIKFREQILKEYIRLSKLAEANGRSYEITIDEMLRKLQKLYKQRGKDVEKDSPN